MAQVGLHGRRRPQSVGRFVIRRTDTAPVYRDREERRNLPGPLTVARRSYGTGDWRRSMHEPMPRRWLRMKLANRIQIMTYSSPDAILDLREKRLSMTSD